MAPRYGSALEKRGFANNLNVQVFVELICPIFATFVVIARFSLRRYGNIALKYDDLFIALAAVFQWGYWAIWYHICTFVVPHGESMTELSRDQATEYLKASYPFPLLYNLSLGCIKISISLFFLRAFGTTRQKRIWIYAILVFCLLVGAARLIAPMVQCTPVSAFWTGRGTCLHSSGLYVSLESLDLTSELALLIFPAAIIWRLQLPLRKRVPIVLIFALGTVICVICAYRIYLIYRLTGMTTGVISDLGLPLLVVMGFITNSFGIFIASLPPTYSPLQSFLKSLLGRNSSKPPSGTLPTSIECLNRPPKSDTLVRMEELSVKDVEISRV